MRLEERTRIDADPDTVFRFFEEMESNYVDWHPDHLEFRWVEGDGLEEGATAYFEERVGGEQQTKTVQFTSIEPGRYVEFEPTSFLVRLLLPEIGFTIEPGDEGCVVTQHLRVRTGPIGAWLNRREFDAVRQHMREEGENLRRLVEEDS